MINVLPWNADRAVVRCVAQLVKGVTMEVPLAAGDAGSVAGCGAGGP